MVKGSDGRVYRLSGPFFYFHCYMQNNPKEEGRKMKKTSSEKVKEMEKKAGKKIEKKDVIASRKSCDASGTGLSHYILMDRKAK